MSKYGYGKTYSDLISPSDLTLAIRKEAYGIDVGQHSWLTVNELNKFIDVLSLNASIKILDIGSGAGGPTRYIAKLVGCCLIGIDVDQNGVEAANKLAHEQELTNKVTFKLVDANQGLPFADQEFDRVISLDAIIHIKNRGALFSEIARVLSPNGIFLFTDAGVLTGTVSNNEFALRSINGCTFFSSPGYNEKLLQENGFELTNMEDTTKGALDIAKGRLRARDKFRHDVETIEGTERFNQEQAYLQTVVNLSAENRLSRFSYFAKKK